MRCLAAGLLALPLAVVGSVAAAPRDHAAAPQAAAAAKASAASAGKTEPPPAPPAAVAQSAQSAQSAQAAQSFEELLKGAVPIKDLATLIAPLYLRCDEPRDLARRQCEGARSFLLDYLHSHTFVADADVQPDTSPYDAVAKQIDMEVSGCLTCVNPPIVAGEPRYLATRPLQRVVNGKATAAPLANHEIEIHDRVHADRFVERVVPRLRVQHIFRLGAPFGELAATPEGGPPAKAAGPAPVKGVLITSIAHRVYDRCTGQVAAAVPKALGVVKVAADKSCPPKDSEELSQAELKLAAAHAALPERLTPPQIEAGLQPIQEKIHECYVEFGEPSGVAMVQLTVGPEGKLTNIVLRPPFDKADIGVCIRSQLKSATFPKFRGEPMRMEYTYQVN